MLRSSFFATGLFVLLCGVMFLFVDKIVLSSQEDPSRTPGIRGMFMSVNGNRQEVVDPPDWAAFSLMSVGAVTVLYSIALPRKKS